MARFHSLQIAELKPETDEAILVTFAVPKELAEEYRYQQGQHLTLRTWIGAEEIRRSYSLCSGVDEGELKVAIKRVPSGRFSNFALNALAVGATLDVMTPIGGFRTPLDAGARKSYVAFAAGSGITPVLSILKSVLAREPSSRFTLFYGNRTFASILFREELEDLKDRYLGRFRLFHILSREEQEISLLKGRIDKAKVDALCRALCPPSMIDEAFLCGPSTMIPDAQSQLLALGVPSDHIHFELFTTAPVGLAPRESVHGPIEGAGRASRITLLKDGASREINVPYGGASILEAGLVQGLDLPFSCKSGVCSTCRAKVLRGRVDMALNYALDEKEVAAGFVLTCQSRPLTDKVVLDYDQT
jgi:ring-1,2-phenylacetyl-CoA epoxidase subunit PaaE